MPKDKLKEKIITKDWKGFLDWVNGLSPWNLWQPPHWQSKKELNLRVSMDLNELLDKVREETKKEIMEGVLECLPKEVGYSEDDNRYPDGRWQKENYGNKKYTQAIRQMKHNILNLSESKK